jgi:hypothetical protein
MKNRFLLIALTILTTGLFVTSNLRAGDELGPDPGNQPEAQPGAQPQPTSTVGRLSLINGQVSTMHGDGTQWVAGTVNTPVVPGDKVATADRSRAEIQLDPANVMRLDEHTEAQVADLQQNKIQIQLASGLVDFSVLNGTQADVEVDTPNMGVHPLSPGIYRIQVSSSTETLLIVRKGEAEVLTNQGSTKVEAGQIIQIHGTDNPEYKIDSAPGGDDFDKWSSNRDREIMSVQAAHPAQGEQPSYVGSSDLDTYGQWSEVPDQGWCWTPQVDIGWVPYTYGRWGYEPFWGWTWISAEPWGWAPYHYGSWFMFGGRWRWRPDGFGGRGGFYGGRGFGNFGGSRFLPRGLMNGRPGGNLPRYAGRSNYMGSTGRMGFGGTANNWHGFSRGNQSGRGPTAGYGSSAGFQGRSAPAARGYQNNWQRYASPSPYGGARSGYGQSTQRGGYQGYSGQSRNYSGGGYAGRSGGSYYGGGSRPPLQLNQPLMRQRAPGGGYYGGGRSYAAPSGGGRSYSAPSGGGGRSYSAPKSGGGGGGVHNYGGGGGGHSYGGGGGGGHSSAGGGGGHGGGRR